MQLVHGVAQRDESATVSKRATREREGKQERSVKSSRKENPIARVYPLVTKRRGSPARRRLRHRIRRRDCPPAGLGALWLSPRRDGD